MHPPLPAHDDFPDPTELQRMVRLRFARRDAVLAGLLEALFGVLELADLDARQLRRLYSMLEARDDAALEVIARRGHPGRSRLVVEFEVLFDGTPDAAEQQAMARRLLALLSSAPWPAPTLDVRSVVLTSCASTPLPE